MSDLSIDSAIKQNSLAYYAQSIAGNQGVSGVEATQPLSSSIVSNDPLTSPDTSGVNPASSTQISKQGQLFSQLQQLQTQDPAKFKQVLTDVANQLTTAAQNATGNDQKFLTNLADKFTKAASGDLSALQPPAPNGSSPAAAAYQQGSQTAASAQALDLAAQAAQNNSNGQQSNGSGHGGGHHHHHGGHGHLSASTQQTLQSVFSELNTAVSGTSSSSGASGGGVITAQDPLPPSNSSAIAA